LESLEPLPLEPQPATPAAATIAQQIAAPVLELIMH
jgi:hypothetical protein